MAAILNIPLEICGFIWNALFQVPIPVLVISLLCLAFFGLALLYVALTIIAPIPRPAHISEKHYVTTTPDGGISEPQLLSCWHDEWVRHRTANEKARDFTDKHTGHIDDAEVALSVIIPAYNEEERLEIMLEEAVAYLDATYGRPKDTSTNEKAKSTSTSISDGSGMKLRSDDAKATTTTATAITNPSSPQGYEILLVNDGSRDNTVRVALNFSKKHKLHNILRVISLKSNRGKGGAVVHGLRHARGLHAIFADADGASRFSDVGALIAGASAVADESGRAVAVGSRAHLVGSEAVVQRSWIRNLLMHSFHLLLRVLTPRETSRVRDTQCGFKVFSREALPFIVPYMHAEGWIFDVEMLMLAESAPECVAKQETEVVLEGEGKIAKGTKVRGPGIRVAEVPIQWKEVGGSKLNVLWDSLGMAWGLAVLRASWIMGVYRRR